MQRTENTVVNNLCNDMVTDANLVSALATLGLTDMVAELDASNKAFNAAFLERNKEIADNEHTATGELLKVAVEKYETLMSHITAHATLHPSEAYTSLVNQINALIDKYNMMVSLRESKTEAEV